MTKKTKIVVSIGLSLFILFSIIFFFYDLNISKLLVDDTPGFFLLLLEAIGEFPIYIGPILFGLVYGFTSNKNNHKLTFHLIGLISTYVAVIRLISSTFLTFFDGKLSLIQHVLLSIASLLLYLFFFLVLKRVKVEKISKIKDIALLYLIVSISSFICVSCFKIVWGRQRFYSLSQEYTEYNNFLSINFFDGMKGEAYCSFPSGHTNAATCVFIFSFIQKRLYNKKWFNCFSMICCTLYVIMVAMSRICIGAHYASDVLFGFGINIVCLISAYVILKKKEWLDVRGN